MPKVNLTDRFVIGAKSKDAPQTDYFDEHTPGLALRVSSAGHKAWTFTFTSPKDGKRARLTLGSYPSTSLAGARTKAEESRGYLEEDPPRDPRDVLAAQDASAVTVSMLFDSWSEMKLAALRSAEHIKRRMRRNVIPKIGSNTLATLHKRDVSSVIAPLLRRGAAIEANRVFENMRAMFRWAVADGYLDHNPMEGMKKPAEEVTRDRSLTEEEIGAVWNKLPQAVVKSEDVQRIAKLCLVTMQRVGEVAGMRRAELDLKKAIWTIPGARTKNGKTHEVPLSALAVEIIRQALKAAGDDAEFVFPSGERAIHPRAVTRTICRAQKAMKGAPNGKFGVAPWTPHDLRRTGLTQLAKLTVAPIVIGAVANHLSVTKASVTFANYVQYDYAKEKRAALELWADRLAAITAGRGAKVLPMRKRRAAQ